MANLLDISYTRPPGDKARIDHSVTHLLDDSYIVAWTEGDGSESGIYFRRYAYDYVTEEFTAFDAGPGMLPYLNTAGASRANTYTPNIQQRPRLLPIDDYGAAFGGFSVAWESTNVATNGSVTGTAQDGSLGGIYGQIFDYQGSRISVETRLSPTTAGNQMNPVIIPWVDDYGYDLGWTEGTAKTGGTLWLRGFAQRADGLGYVAEDAGDMVFDPSALTEHLELPFYNGVITFASGGGAAGSSVYLYAADGSGTPVNPDGSPSTAPYSTVAIGIVDSDADLVALIYPQQDPTASATSLRLARTNEGSYFFATWIETKDSATTLYGQRYTINGDVAGSATELATGVENNFHSMTRLDSGMLLLVWSDGAGNAIKGRWLDGSTGAAITDAVTLLDYTSNLTIPRLSPDYAGGALLMATRDGGVIGKMVTDADMFGALPDITDPTQFDDALDVASAFLGSAAAETFLAGGGNDFIDGGAGNDTMFGGTGNDVYIVGDLGDVVNETGGSGLDEVWAVINSVTLPTGVEDLYFKDRAGNLAEANVTATGNDTNNFIQSGTGNDTIDGGGGYNVIDFGNSDNPEAESDTARLSGDIDADAVAVLIIDLPGDSYTLNSKNTGEIVSMSNSSGRTDRMVHVEMIQIGDGDATDVGATGVSRTVKADKYLSDDDNKGKLDGTSKNEVLDGLDGADTLTGGAGNDALLGRAGADSLLGGTGNDTLDGGFDIDILDGGAGNDAYLMDIDMADTIVDSAGVDVVSTRLAEFSIAGYAMIENLEHLGANAFRGTGNALANKITGAAGKDTLDGGAGADNLAGGVADDTYIVGTGDIINEKTAAGVDAGGSDTVQTALAAYTLGLYLENLSYTGASTFTGTGNALNNTLTGGSGNDKLYGVLGDDSFIATAGNDLFDGGGGADTLDLTGLDLLFAKKGKEGGFTVTKTDASTVLITSGSQVLTVKGAWGAATGDKGIETFKFDDNAAVTLADLLVNAMSSFADTFSDSEGVNDIVKSGLGNDTLSGMVGNDNLDGEGGNDSLDGGIGDDTLTGGLGNDILIGGSGNDSLSGGLGDDVYYVDAEADSVSESLAQGTDTVRTTLAGYNLADKAANVEKLIYDGTANFTGSGNALANTITGNTGNDTLDGGENDGKADILNGGAGDDTYKVGAGDTANEKTVAGVDAGGSDTVQTALAAYTLGLYLENLSYTGASTFTGTGNALNNTLTGGIGNDKLYGVLGDDSFIATAGNDLFDGGGGADTLDLTGLDLLFAKKGKEGGFTVTKTDASTVLITSGSQVLTVKGAWGAATGDKGIETFKFDDNAAVTLADLLVNAMSSFADTFSDSEGVNDIVKSGLGNDTLSGMVGNDNLDGEAGNDSLDGGIGDDTLTGGLGNDILIGGLGNDSLTGGLGDDVYYVDAEADSVSESLAQGSDTVRTTLAGYNLADKAANVEKLIYDGAANFTGSGNTLANTITGNIGNDTLDGGADLLADILNGGAGDDTYKVGAGDTANEKTVAGVDAGGSDTVQTALAAYTLGLYLENLSYTGASTFTGTGNALNNTLTGGSGNDKLYGALGDDSFIATAGNDLFDGGGGADTLDLTGLDLLFAKKGKEGGFTVTKADASTVLITSGSQVLTVKGAWGAATGDKGIETFKFDDNAAVTLADLLVNAMSSFADTFSDSEGVNDIVKSGLGNDTLSGMVGNDNLDGEGGNDSLDGGIGDDTLTGGLGNDILIGGSGNDSLSGGLGDDVYYVDAEADSVSESLAQGTDTVRTTLAGYNLADKAANVEKLIYDGTANFTGSGNALANTITGNTGNDSLDGGENDGKADILNGGAGNDTYKVGAGDTVVDLEGAADIVLVQGSLAAWTLGLTLENLTNQGTAATFTGNGNLNANVLTGGSNIDILNGLAGNDSLTGNDGADKLYGGAGTDSLLGGSGDDLLDGGTESDTLDGGDGNDKLYGGLGDDHFVFSTTLNAGTNVDSVMDFVRLQGDRIDLDLDIFGGLGTAGAQLSGDLFASVSQTTTDLTVVEAGKKIIYNSKTGELYFDADGAGVGSDAILFAKIGIATSHPALDATDFWLIA